MLLESSRGLICNEKGLETAKSETKDKENVKVKLEYSIIYADLFKIEFANLKKLKIKGHHRSHSESITSLEAITCLKAPLLE